MIAGDYTKGGKVPEDRLKPSVRGDGQYRYHGSRP